MLFLKTPLLPLHPLIQNNNFEKQQKYLDKYFNNGFDLTSNFISSPRILQDWYLVFWCSYSYVLNNYIIKTFDIYLLTSRKSVSWMHACMLFIHYCENVLCWFIYEFRLHNRSCIFGLTACIKYYLSFAS